MFWWRLQQRVIDDGARQRRWQPVANQECLCILRAPLSLPTQHDRTLHPLLQQHVVQLLRISVLNVTCRGPCRNGLCHGKYMRPFPLQHVQLAVVFSLVLPKHTFEADIIVGAKAPVWPTDRLRRAARAHGTRREKAGQAQSAAQGASA
jgi:hypothetical protein